MAEVAANRQFRSLFAIQCCNDNTPHKTTMPYRYLAVSLDSIRRVLCNHRNNAQL